MTREEAIKYLKEMKDQCDDTIHKVRYVTQEEALDMAIKALEQEPNGDLISRQAVHEAITRWAGSMSVLIALPTREVRPLLDSIHELPSVKQEPKTGHWINDEDTIGCYYCSECGGYVTSYDDAYCKYCGAKMVEPQETETWNGIHAQITAPKGTFERIFNDADDDNDI